MQNNTITGSLGTSYVGTAVMQAPPAPGSMSDALARLSLAISGNSDLTSQLGQQLETSGFLRPSAPTPDRANEAKPSGSQIAHALITAAMQIEATNARLDDFSNRMDR